MCRDLRRRYGVAPPASCEAEQVPDSGVFVRPAVPVKGDTHASHRKNMGDLSLDGRKVDENDSRGRARLLK
jgi:hypothetical protein